MAAVEKVHHNPVLADEVRQFAAVTPGQVWVDCTLGFAGHTRLLLEDGAVVFGIDQDADARRLAQESLAAYGERVTVLAGNFGELSSLLGAAGVSEVDGVLADIGVSSYQLDQSHRGFSFRLDGPVDMRMNPSAGESAEALIRRLSTGELADILRRLGEEPFAMRIARNIHKWMGTEHAPTTTGLAACICDAVPAKARAKRKHHPATRSFQALRIAVNDELEALENLLDDIPNCLAEGGRALIISFHSLEDRIVKKRFNRWAGRVPTMAPRRGLPPPPSEAPKFELLSKKGLVAGDEECIRNPRARSARLRAIRKREVAA